ncbi:hypothetical protein CDAR_593891 [Caerostris darwini]|uniref:Uncharacterized protein n=1 Tax=Caerostris darwini TaxID=1538125 RepID=A0AAV4RN60_9ARAC|nr:hypothetical protein CDAR_593891 [Caerostris darwini]
MNDGEVIGHPFVLCLPRRRRQIERPRRRGTMRGAEPKRETQTTREGKKKRGPATIIAFSWQVSDNNNDGLKGGFICAETSACVTKLPVNSFENLQMV